MEKSSNKVMIISIILALICIGILGGIVYYKINKKEEPAPEQKEAEKIEEPAEEPIEEPVAEENYEEIVKNLYEIIGNNPEFRETEVVNYESLSENIRDNIVLNVLNSTCEETKTYDKAIFDAKYKEIFNQEKINDDGYCKVDETNYECTRYCGEFSEKVYKKYEKYELADDSIIIYESAGHLDYADDGKIYLKENAIDSKAIASFDSIDDLKDFAVDYKLPEYKHTFTTNGENYYWVSSEGVKQ